MPRISAKNQVTIPVSALDEAGLRAGDEVNIEVLDQGELRVRRSALTFEKAFGALTGAYPPGYLETLDVEDETRGEAIVVDAERMRARHAISTAEAGRS